MRVSAPRDVSITFDKNYNQGGQAITHGSRITCDTGAFDSKNSKKRNGLIVHELVHVVQSTGRDWNNHVPLWLTEGMADYVRYYLYEPGGRILSTSYIPKARYDDSYGITANFLHYIAGTYDKDIVPKINDACRQGNYSDKLWKQYTGHTVRELNTEWKAYLAHPEQATFKYSEEDLRAPFLQQGQASPEKGK